MQAQSESKVSTPSLPFETFSNKTNQSKTVLDPIPTKGLTGTDVDSLTRDTREKMLKIIAELGKDSESRSMSSKKDL